MNDSINNPALDGTPSAAAQHPSTPQSAEASPPPDLRINPQAPQVFGSQTPPTQVETPPTQVPGSETPPTQVSWDRVRHRLKLDLGDNIWRHWLRHLQFIEKNGTAIVLGVHSKLIAKRITSQYSDRLRANFRLEWREVDVVEIRHIHTAHLLPEKPQRVSHNNLPSPYLPSTPRDDAPRDDARRFDEFDDFGARLDPRMNFDNFVVDKPNEFAHAVALKTAMSATPQFNPLFLYGGVGLGKTHLMHAIASRMRLLFPHRRVIYLTAEAFMHLFVKAIRHKDTMQFKDRFRQVDVLMVDDVQFIGGKDSTQEEFFHTFNALVADNKQIIVSADKPPTDLQGMEERLRSRLNWGMVANINPTTFELRLGIIEARNEAESIGLGAEVMAFLAHKITSNVRELEGALNRIVANKMISGASITIDTVRQILADVLRASNRQISIGEIKREVARHYNIRLEEMHSKRRARSIVLPRQVAMYLAKNLTANSYPEIGQHFGGKDHTTVMHAVRKIEVAINEDSGIADDIAMLRALLQASLQV